MAALDRILNEKIHHFSIYCIYRVETHTHTQKKDIWHSALIYEVSDKARTKGTTFDPRPECAVTLSMTDRPFPLEKHFFNNRRNRKRDAAKKKWDGAGFVIRINRRYIFPPLVKNLEEAKNLFPFRQIGSSSNIIIREKRRFECPQQTEEEEEKFPWWGKKKFFLPRPWMAKKLSTLSGEEIIGIHQAQQQPDT